MADNRHPRKLPAWMTQKVVVDDVSIKEESKSSFTFQGKKNNEFISCASQKKNETESSHKSHGFMREENKPSLKFNGVINYCPTVGDMGLACEDLITKANSEKELILGFDAEWPVNYQEGPGKLSLIQICCDETTCHLFHVSLMRALPKIFLQLILHPNIKLVGNCIKNDLWKLGRDFNVQVSDLIKSDRVVDLGHYANEVLSSAQTWSLDRLALHVISVTIDKSDSIRKSKWNLELSAEQSLYAATDAYVSWLIYNKLRAKQASAL